MVLKSSIITRWFSGNIFEIIFKASNIIIQKFTLRGSLY